MPADLANMWGSILITQAGTDLAADCSQCFGLCCIALSFTRQDGFGHDKPGGQACHFLQSDYRCAIHERRDALGYEGCGEFDCLGAGQRASRQFGGLNWRQDAATARQLYARFAELLQIQEMRQALVEAGAEELDDWAEQKRLGLLGQLEELADSPHGAIPADVVGEAKALVETMRDAR